MVLGPLQQQSAKQPPHQGQDRTCSLFYLLRKSQPEATLQLSRSSPPQNECFPPLLLPSTLPPRLLLDSECNFLENKKHLLKVACGKG